MATQNKTEPAKRKVTKVVQHGRLYVNATFNNTLASVTDEGGNVLCCASTGGAGFTGSRKSTPYAATLTIEGVLNKAKTYGMTSIDVFIKGPGPGRDVALRVIRAQGVKVGILADVTPIPHNGTRPRKAKHNR